MNARAHIAHRIKNVRTQKLNMTAAELGKLLNPPRSGKTISSWETRRTLPDADTLLQLCLIFDEPISAFYPKEFSKGAPLAQEGAYAKIPLYGSIAAGKPLAIIPIEDTKPIPLEMHHKYPEAFLLKVEGESMNNVLPNGSYALVDPEQNEAKDFAAYALNINGSDATIKRIRKLANGIELIPDSKDPTFKPSIFDYAEDDPSEITIIGRVVWLTFPFDWEI